MYIRMQARFRRTVMGRLDGTIALVTGGAKGLGRAACLRLASDGSELAILDKDPAGEVVEKIEAAGGKAFALQCDVADEEDVAGALREVERRVDRPGIRVNNGGMLWPRKSWLGWQTGWVQRYLDVKVVG